MPEWTPEIAEKAAAAAGIPTLTADHWTLISHCREDAARRGIVADLERLSALTGLTQTRIRQLFPGNSGALVARIAGLPAAEVAPATGDPAEPRGHRARNASKGD